MPEAEGKRDTLQSTSSQCEGKAWEWKCILIPFLFFWQDLLFRSDEQASYVNSPRCETRNIGGRGKTICPLYPHTFLPMFDTKTWIDVFHGKVAFTGETGLWESQGMECKQRSERNNTQKDKHKQSTSFSFFLGFQAIGVVFVRLAFCILVLLSFIQLWCLFIVR